MLPATIVQHKLLRVLGQGLLIGLLVLLPLSTSVRADGGVIVLDGKTGPFLVTVFAAPAPLRAGPMDLSVLLRDATTGSPLLDVDVRFVLRRVDNPLAASIGAAIGEGGREGHDEHAVHGGRDDNTDHADATVHAAHTDHTDHTDHTTSGVPDQTLRQATATREAATNKLLRAALIDLPAAGEWVLTVEVSRHVRGAEADHFPVESTANQIAVALSIGPPLPAWVSRWKELLLPAIVIALFLLNQRLRGRRRGPFSHSPK